MRKNIFYCLTVVVIFILTSNLEAKSCSDVKSEFTKKITEMKEKWEKEDKNIDSMIEAFENQIVSLEKNEGSSLIKINDKYENERKNELEKIKKAYETTLMKLESEEKADQEKINKMNADNDSKRAALVQLKENIEKIISSYEPLKQQLLSTHEKEKEKIEADHEIARMKDEDDDRKLEASAAEEYQKEFDSLNKELEVWDKNEETVKSTITAVDKEIEKYAVDKATEMEKVQNEIEKKRAEAQKIYDSKKGDPAAEAAYISENEKLDSELAKQSNIFNGELKKFRETKLKEKKEKEKKYSDFIKKKDSAKKSVQERIKKAQENRDKKIAAQKALRNARDAKWKNEALSKEASLNKEITDKYTKPRDAAQKQLDSINDKITDLDDKTASDRTKAADDFNSKKEKREKIKESAETAYNNESDKIKLKYDNLILAEKQKAEKTKQDIVAKRDALLDKKEENKIRNQKTLDTEKAKYDKAMSECKN